MPRVTLKCHRICQDKGSSIAGRVVHCKVGGLGMSWWSTLKMLVLHFRITNLLPVSTSLLVKFAWGQMANHRGDNSTSHLIFYNGCVVLVGSMSHFFFCGEFKNCFEIQHLVGFFLICSGHIFLPLICNILAFLSPSVYLAGWPDASYFCWKCSLK